MQLGVSAQPNKLPENYNLGRRAEGKLQLENKTLEICKIKVAYTTREHTKTEVIFLCKMTCRIRLWRSRFDLELRNMKKWHIFDFLRNCMKIRYFTSLTLYLCLQQLPWFEILHTYTFNCDKSIAIHKIVVILENLVQKNIFAPLYTNFFGAALKKLTSRKLFYYYRQSTSISERNVA